MSNQLLAKWHAYMDKPSEAALSDMLHDDVTFVSPVVFTPQKGKAVAIKYLLSAGIVFQDEGLITQFKVMVRPLQAVNMLWQQMGAQLEKASA